MIPKVMPSNLSSSEKLGEFLFKWRDYTPVPLISIGILWADPVLWSIVVGFFVSLLGEFIRFYGVAFIGGISRTRGYSNGDLITSGPFSVVRNPLYLGNFLLVLGIGVMSALWWFPLLIIAMFYLQYIPIVTWEEKKLDAIFGENYQIYKRAVTRRWFPSFSDLMSKKWWLPTGDWKGALRSEKRTFLAVFLISGGLFLLFLWNALSVNDFLPIINLL